MEKPALSFTTLATPPDMERWSEWVDLDDGRRARAKLMPDNDTTLEGDGDWYGTLKWTGERRSNRPEGFDGSARRVWTDQRGGSWWWQPPEDLRREREKQDKLYNVVRSYFAGDWWYVGVVVEVAGAPCPACGERAIKHASLWGIESDAGDYIDEVITDLIDEAT